MTQQSNHNWDDLAFPEDFTFGAATAAYQIEGAAYVEGKGLSVWDEFCRRPGTILNGDTGNVACDFYHRYKEDIALMKELGLQMFRFSVCWPRVFPDGSGRVNEAGIAFYQALVDELLANDVEPFITLNHWDYPLELEKQGGWGVKDNCKHFADYARFMVERLGDRVKKWTTHNEPHNTVESANIKGIFAPGNQDVTLGLRILHHLNYGHGLAVQAMKAQNPDVQVGVALALFPVYPATDDPADIGTSRRCSQFYNDCFLRPIYRGSYPAEIVDFFGDQFPTIDDGDMAVISTPVDLLGINCYYRKIVSAAENNGFLGARERPPQDVPATAMGWEIRPENMHDVLMLVDREYGARNIYITESGAAFDDQVSDDGAVHDADRAAYHRGYLAQACRTLQDGVDLKGYLAWSFIDNFEWICGYDRRFGLVYVDFETQRRIIKDSGYWYRDLIRCNRSS